MMTAAHAAGTSSSKHHGRLAPPNPVHVLIVDDHPLVARGLAQMLAETSDLCVVGTAPDAACALALLASASPRVDAMVVDISLKGGSGIDLIKTVRQRYGAAIRVLVVSMHDESLYAERALRAGASGYVVKDQPADTILAALREVVRGGTWVSEALSARIQRRSGGATSGGVGAVGVGGALNLAAAPQGARASAAWMAGATDSPLATLTDRELEVFQLIGDGRSTREIGKALHISVKTVESHRLHIKDKLALRTGTELIRYAVRWTHEAATVRDD